MIIIQVSGKIVRSRVAFGAILNSAKESAYIESKRRCKGFVRDHIMSIAVFLTSEFLRADLAVDSLGNCLLEFSIVTC